MEEEKFKLYSQRAIAIATFFGGTLATGILIRRNSLNLGKEKEGLIALIIGVVSTILLIWLAFQIPEDVPNAIFPAVYTAIAYGIVELLHGKELKKHKEEKNEFYSNWKAAGVGLVCSIVFIGGVFVYAYKMPADWDVKTYDKKITEFLDNEAEALRLYEMLERNRPAHEIVFFIEQTGIPKWKENIEIINEISNIENLPETFQRKNRLLLEYSKLRIEVYEFISKQFLNETFEHDLEIMGRHIRIERIIEEISSMFR